MAFKEYQKNLPIGFRSNVQNFAQRWITLGELQENPNTPIDPLGQLPRPAQIKVATARIEQDPEFKASFFSQGTFTKNESIKEVREQTLIGRDLLKIESIAVELLVEEVSGSPTPRVTTDFTPLSTLEDESILKLDADWGDSFEVAEEVRNDHVFSVLNTSKVVNCSSAFAKRDRVERILNNKPIKFISGSGHGTTSEFKGFENDTVFTVDGLTSQLVGDKIIHLFSCYTAEYLGREMRRYDAIFAGYSGNIAANSRKAIKNDARFDQVILSGGTTGKAKQAVLRSYKHDASLFRNNSETRNAACMLYNASLFELLGPEDVSIDTI